MPLIELSILQGRLTPATEQQLITRLTAAVSDTFGPAVGEQTWVVLTEVAANRWGVAGTPCAPPDPVLDQTSNAAQRDGRAC